MVQRLNFDIGILGSRTSREVIKSESNQQRSGIGTRDGRASRRQHRIKTQDTRDIVAALESRVNRAVNLARRDTGTWGYAIHRGRRYVVDDAQLEPMPRGGGLRSRDFAGGAETGRVDGESSMGKVGLIGAMKELAARVTAGVVVVAPPVFVAAAEQVPLPSRAAAPARQPLVLASLSRKSTRNAGNILTNTRDPSLSAGALDADGRSIVGRCDVHEMYL